jgi:hypothetical protein
VGWNNSGI